MSEQGRSAEEMQLVWEAVALHSSADIASRMAPEIALVALGASADAVGVGLDQLAPADVAAILRAYPRLGFKEAALRASSTTASVNRSHARCIRGPRSGGATSKARACRRSRIGSARRRSRSERPPNATRLARAARV
jgi:hypothetical protein